MVEESEKPEDQPQELLGGERLRKARRHNDISIRDIAKELHLDEPKVRALEENNFDLFGAPVFAKGHLKKYAELVGVSVDDVLSDYYKLNRTAATPPVVGPRKKHRRDFTTGPWLIGGLVVILLAGATWWWLGRDPAPVQVQGTDVEPATLAPFATDQDTESAEEPASGPDVALPLQDSDSDTTDATAVEDEVVEEITTDTTPEESIESAPLITEPVVQDASSSGLPQVLVELSFSGDCWTEASDASGRRLFYDLGAAGRVVSIGGDAPLRIILGDADNVSLKVNGRDFAIPASARSGRLARLTINRP